MIKILNEANEATILMTGDIGQSWFSDGWTLEKFKDAVSGLTASALTIEVKSNGGDVMEAFAIYDQLKSLPVRVTVKIIGSSASAATIIASGADQILISENSRYLVHNAQTFVEGNKERLKDAYEQLSSFDDQILDIYVKRTGKSRDLLAQLMTEERWMTAQEALEWGFVDEIIKTDNKPKNMAKVKNEDVIEMTPEELQAENEALKSQLAELKSKLAEFEQAQAEMEEEEIDAAVTAAIEAGKFKAEAKESWLKFGRADKQAMKSAINAIEKPVVDLSKVPDTGAGAPAPETKESIWASFKEGKINAAQYADKIANLKQ